MTSMASFGGRVEGGGNRFGVERREVRVLVRVVGGMGLKLVERGG
jgi:hypothetical protein